MRARLFVSPIKNIRAQASVGVGENGSLESFFTNFCFVAAGFFNKSTPWNSFRFPITGSAPFTDQVRPGPACFSNIIFHRGDPPESIDRQNIDVRVAFNDLLNMMWRNASEHGGCRM